MSILKIKDSQGNWVGVPTVKGDTGNGISSAVLNNDYTLTLTFTDGTTYTTPSIRGEKGEQGEPATDMEIHICSASEYDSETRIPTITSPDDKTFYLVPTEDGTSPDLFTEWVYVNNAWEMFGSASIDLTDYVKNTDYATGAKAGVIKLNPNYGINVTDDGILYVNIAESKNAKMGTNNARPITPIIQHESTFYGLAKVAGHDEKNSTLPVGQYTDEAKASIQNMLGITDKYSPKEWVAESETELVTNAHNIGDLFYIGETLYKVIADLNAGDAINVGVNVEEVNVNDILDDYATKEDIEDNVSIVEKSASGSVASFNDGMDNMPLKSLMVDINPVQDLHGYDSPWVGGGGSNKWDEQWEVGSLNSNTGLPVDSTTLIRSKNFCECLPSTEYAKVCSPTSYVNVFWYDENQTFISLSGGGGNNPYSVITSPSNAKYFKIRTESAYGTTYKNDIAVNYPSTVTTYSPYENICPISGWTGCNLNKTGVNIWNKTLINGDVDIDVISGVVYTISAKASSNAYLYLRRRAVGTSDYSRVAWVLSNTTSGMATFTPEEGYVYSLWSNATSYPKISDVQLGVGSTATTYEPYTGCTIPINWQTEAGTVYGGKLDVLSGVLRVDKGIYEADGSDDESIALYSGERFEIRNIPNYKSPVASIKDDILCNRLKAIRKGAQGSTIGVISGSDAGSARFMINVGTSTVAETKTWLSENPLTIVYPLATPIEIQLTPQQVNSLLGVNNIWTNTGNTSVEYFSQVDKDLMDYIETSLKPYAKEERLNDYVSDVQIDGTSIVTNNVANVPIATQSVIGALYTASEADGKVGTHTYRAIVPRMQHSSVFYGLAKAAGDVTQSQSSNAVGNYTEDAKSAISDMLNGAIQISGTDPTIVAKSGIRYICGEVLSLDFTPPASGVCDVVFTSGSTPTVLTIPDTIRWANDFDPTSLEVNTTYEINIMDGLGVAVGWT